MFLQLNRSELVSENSFISFLSSRLVGINSNGGACILCYSRVEEAHNVGIEQYNKMKISGHSQQLSTKVDLLVNVGIIFCDQNRRQRCYAHSNFRIIFLC